jgi:hypothetical protein
MVVNSMDTADLDPYSAPTLFQVKPRTSRGYSPIECFVWALFLGVWPAAVAGIGVALLSAMSASAVLQLAPIGVMFGASLWVVVEVLVGGMSAQRRLMLIAGCIGAFLFCGLVYDSAVGGVYHPNTFNSLRPAVLGTATGATLLVIVLRTVGGPTTTIAFATLWGAFTTLGTMGIYIVEQVHWSGDAMFVSFTSATIFQTVMLALIAWQLGNANAAAGGEHRVNPDLCPPAEFL